MRSKKTIMGITAIMVVVIVVVIAVLMSRKQIDFELLATKTGIESTEDIEYVMFYIGSRSELYETKYYITDRELIEKIYHIFDEVEYKDKNGFDDVKTNLLYCVWFGQPIEENANLVIYGYNVKGTDTMLAWPILADNYGSVKSAYWEKIMKNEDLTVNTDIQKKLQEIVDNDLKNITMEEIKTIFAEKDIPEIFDFYGYLHEQTGLYNPNEEPAEKLYQINRLEIEDYDGYLEVKNQYETVYAPDLENCHWYHDILSVCLYSSEGDLQEVLYERKD